MIDFANFTLLLPVYIGDEYENFVECIASIKANNVQPAEILIIFDGPVISKVNSFVDALSESDAHVHVLKLPTNLGLSAALNTAIEYSRFEVLCRMDADDICEVDRFKCQWGKFHGEQYDLLGSAISEFGQNPQEILTVRTYPQSISDIKRYIKYRNPFAHPSVMFRKEIYLRAGRYHVEDRYFEDWGLWLRMLQISENIGNLEQPLVKMRANIAQTQRRRGVMYMYHEWRFFLKYQKSKHLNLNSLLYLLLVRTPIRILPKKILKAIFVRFR